MLIHNLESRISIVKTQLSSQYIYQTDFLLRDKKSKKTK